MKKKMLILAVLCAAGTVTAQGRLLKSIDFESKSGFQQWPEDAVVELDTEDAKQGKSSIVFTPDNNYVAYFYQKLAPGHEYCIKFWVKMEKAPIKRCGVSIAFAKEGGGNGSGGGLNFPIADLAPADNKWHECTVKFKAPPDIVKGQIMLAMHRTDTVVFMDDFKLYDTSVEAPKPVERGTAVSKGQLLKSISFANASGLMKWPNDVAFDFQKPDGPEGRPAIVFTPAASYSAYFYQQMNPGQYSIEFDWMANEKPISRCGVIVFFTSKGGKRGDLGQKTVPLESLGEADGSWKHAAIPVTVPQGAGITQIMLAMYRTNTPVYIADLKIFQEEAQTK